MWNILNNLKKFMREHGRIPVLPFFREVNYVNRYCCGNFNSPRTGRYIGHTYFGGGRSFRG